MLPVGAHVCKVSFSGSVWDWKVDCYEDIITVQLRGQHDWDTYVPTNLREGTLGTALPVIEASPSVSVAKLRFACEGSLLQGAAGFSLGMAPSPPASEVSSRILIRETKINITMRYHLTLVRKAVIKTSTNNKCYRGCGEKGTLPHCWWEYKMIQPPERTVWSFLKI